MPGARPRPRRPRVVDELIGRRASGRPARAPRGRGSGSPGAAVAIAVMLVAGLEFTANPGDRPLFGRTGPVQAKPVAGPGATTGRASVPGERRTVSTQ